jgi:hypothetical protein
MSDEGIVPHRPIDGGRYVVVNKYVVSAGCIVDAYVVCAGYVVVEGRHLRCARHEQRSCECDSAHEALRAYRTRYVPSVGSARGNVISIPPRGSP